MKRYYIQFPYSDKNVKAGKVDGFIRREDIAKHKPMAGCEVPTIFELKILNQSEVDLLIREVQKEEEDRVKQEELADLARLKKKYPNGA